MKAPLIDIHTAYKSDLVKWAVIRFGWKKSKVTKMSKKQLKFFWYNQSKFAKNSQFV